jgi:RimJ/RimL family protein N-acetyltransferase
MLTTHWPLFGLRVRTPTLELRLPSTQDLVDLAEVAAAGIHDPAVMPFLVSWTDAAPAERARAVMQYHWRTWGQWRPDHWTLELAVVRAGEVVGVQAVTGRNFAVLRQVDTGSWLGGRFQGQGIGTEMRAAVVHLAFAGLGAQYAISSAFEDNAASFAVSRKLGYVDNGVDRYLVRDKAQEARRLLLTRQRWEATRSVPVQIEGLEPCLPQFGV